VGYLSSYTNYWSKTDPDNSKFTDLMYAERSCFYQYDSSSAGDYSTFLYRDLAVSRIQAHDFSAAPLFLYLPFQAVHDPFADPLGSMTEGITQDYLDADTYNYIITQFEVSKKCTGKPYLCLKTNSRG
jgi:hypothetical protein